jgi:hypothetical protein
MSRSFFYIHIITELILILKIISYVIYIYISVYMYIKQLFIDILKRVVHKYSEKCIFQNYLIIS